MLYVVLEHAYIYKIQNSKPRQKHSLCSKFEFHKNVITFNKTYHIHVSCVMCHLS